MNKQIVIWLSLSALMVIIMVFVGGWTRLSDAGLSIVEWKPITGIIPPIMESDWEIEFGKYKDSPEFKKLNNHFTLSAFKEIFWLEYLHRILGRLTGIIILLPAIFFWYKGQLRDWKPYVAMIFLVAFQGFIGWWMVKSGLVNNPHVSHFRLATHLITALILYSVILWELLDKNFVTSKSNSHRSNISWGAFSLFILFVQIFLGALVAGLDGGMIYNSFPLMGNNFIPSEFEFSSQMMYDPASIQFLHRCFGYFTAIVLFILAYKIRSFATKAAIMLVCTVFIQILLGIYTVIYVVPMNFALAHQLFAVLLLSLVLYIKWRKKYE